MTTHPLPLPSILFASPHLRFSARRICSCSPRIEPFPIRLKSVLFLSVASLHFAAPLLFLSCRLQSYAIQFGSDSPPSFSGSVLLLSIRFRCSSNPILIYPTLFRLKARRFKSTPFLIITFPSQLSSVLFHGVSDPLHIPSVQFSAHPARIFSRPLFSMSVLGFTSPIHRSAIPVPRHASQFPLYSSLVWSIPARI